MSSSSILESAIINLIVVGVMFIVLMKYGLLAGVAMEFSFALFMRNLPATLDRSAWYFGSSWLGIAIFAAIAFWSYRTSLGGQTLFKTE